MKDFTVEIESVKKQVAGMRSYNHQPEGWIIRQNQTGYFIMEINAYSKLSKAKQKIIEKHYGG